jgi:hypothetical protein
MVPQPRNKVLSPLRLKKSAVLYRRPVKNRGEERGRERVSLSLSLFLSGENTQSSKQVYLHKLKEKKGVISKIQALCSSGLWFQTKIGMYAVPL